MTPFLVPVAMLELARVTCRLWVLAEDGTWLSVDEVAPMAPAFLEADEPAALPADALPLEAPAPTDETSAAGSTAPDERLGW